MVEAWPFSCLGSDPASLPPGCSEWHFQALPPCLWKGLPKSHLMGSGGGLVEGAEGPHSSERSDWLPKSSVDCGTVELGILPCTPCSQAWGCFLGLGLWSPALCWPWVQAEDSQVEPGSAAVILVF